MTWNIKGMNADDKVRQVFMLRNAHRLSLLSLVETKLSTDNIDTQVFYMEHYNDTGSNGRI